MVVMLVQVEQVLLMVGVEEVEVVVYILVVQEVVKHYPHIIPLLHLLIQHIMQEMAVVVYYQVLT